MPSWIEMHSAVANTAQRQIFFVGGAPRSGTTWLQQMLDFHPDISCKGEGLFMKYLAEPLDAMMAVRGKVLAGKNQTLFGHTGGYRLPDPDDTDFVLGSAILRCLQKQAAAKSCLAVGEKTPENVFFFPRLRRLFPGAKFIAIARDPRDVLASAWHFFQSKNQPDGDAEAKMAFIKMALPSMVEGARRMLEFGETYKADCTLVTYEDLRRAPAPSIGHLYRFLGMSDHPDMVRDCIASTSFAASTGGRPAGVACNGAFLRNGVVGGWQNTLTPAMNEVILRDMGWMFPRFGWC